MGAKGASQRALDCFLAKQVGEVIALAITGELPRGEKLNREELAARIGVSRDALQKALRDGGEKMSIVIFLGLCRQFGISPIHRAAGAATLPAATGSGLGEHHPRASVPPVGVKGTVTVTRAADKRGAIFTGEQPSASLQERIQSSGLTPGQKALALAVIDKDYFEALDILNRLMRTAALNGELKAPKGIIET